MRSRRTPTLVVLDEPFSSLDAALRAQVRAEVLDVLRASGSTAVLVTHDQQEALSVADQVAVLLDGRIAQAARAVSLYDRPASLQVATFVGRGDRAAWSVRRPHGDVRARPRSRPGRPKACCRAGHGVLRPEHLLLPAATDPHAGVPATVHSRAFFGHDAVVVARLDDGLLLSIRQHTGDLPAVGERVTGGAAAPAGVLAGPARVDGRDRR